MTQGGRFDHLRAQMRLSDGREEWKEHYADMFEQGIRWKKEFDPHGVFRREGMPFEPSATG